MITEVRIPDRIAERMIAEDPAPDHHQGAWTIKLPDGRFWLKRTHPRNANQWTCLGPLDE